MNWEAFRVRSENYFENKDLENCWGYQIQAGTKWNPGLNELQIKELERLFGFEFPI